MGDRTTEVSPQVYARVGGLIYRPEFLVTGRHLDDAASRESSYPAIRRRPPHT